MSWRTGDGRHRNVGDPPTGAELISPTVQDVAIASASAMVVDDPSEAITEATPFGRSRRRLLAVVLTGMVALTLWAGVVAIAAQSASAGELPIGFLGIELVGLCVLGWTAGFGSIALFGQDGAAMRATFAVPFAVMCSLVWPWTRQHLWEQSDHARNWIILIGAGAALGAWASRDVAARPSAR